MDPLQPIINALHREGRLRVWSLVITIFGDSVQHRGGEISNVRLQQLLGRIGVERGTLRTALSRLVKDGWVEADRTGRSSLYRLSIKGKTQFSDATGRIYAPVRRENIDNWSLSFGHNQHGFEIAPNLFLTPVEFLRQDKEPDCRVTGSLDFLSPSFRENLMSPNHQNAFKDMLADTKSLTGIDLDPLSSAAARTLLIHRWRRLILRYPEVPFEFLPTGLCDTSAREKVRDVYKHLSTKAEQWLDCNDAIVNSMPFADDEFQTRFEN